MKIPTLFPVVCAGLSLIFLSGSLSRAADYAIVISEKTLADEEWAKVADALKVKYPDHVLITTGQLEDALVPLKEHFPRYTCFVATPQEANREFVRRVHEMTRKLDDDVYADTFWGILTGYTAENALSIATHKEPLIIETVSSGTAFATDMITEGDWYDELVPNKHVRKTRDGKVEQLRGPSDTTQSIAELLNKNETDLMITSGHATERDWQIGFAYRNGQFRSYDGQMLGVDTRHQRVEISSSNPKVYLPIGNCLMGNIDKADCMALAWMNDVGVKQMVGYTKNTWFGYMGWGMLDYFVEQPGRYTLNESFVANHHALIHKLNSTDLSPTDLRGLSYDRDIVAFYGDPKWSARMAEKACFYDQELTIKDGEYSLNIIPKQGSKSFMPVNKNGSQRGWRPMIAYLPHRIKDVEVTIGQDLNPVITDDFILVPNPRVCDPERTYRVVFTAATR